LTDLFFTAKGEDTTEAKRVCSTCPVRTECFNHALDNVERFGIWGGTTDRQRITLRRARRERTNDDTP
jgi:WhiB family redox-sensing transcriptional regulator